MPRQPEAVTIVSNRLVFRPLAVAGGVIRFFASLQQSVAGAGSRRQRAETFREGSRLRRFSLNCVGAYKLRWFV
jgi:hypothetical protein